MYKSINLPCAATAIYERVCVCVDRDVMSLGISLVGHQKKVMSSIQTMRAQMLHLHGTGVQV